LAIAVVLGGIEAALRIVGFDVSYWYAVRYAYVSPGAFTQAAPDVPARRPHAALRNAAVYAAGGVTLEYDYVMRTNNLGFAQDRDLVCGKPTTFVFGDSFTEGMGATPWFGAVEDAGDDKNIQIANLGYFGTGMLNWRAMADHYAVCLMPAKALIVYISHDWFRPSFGLSEGQIACIDGSGPCFEPGHLLYPLSNAADAASLVARTRERDAARFAGNDWRAWATRADVELRARSYAFSLVRNVLVSTLGLGEGGPPLDILDRSIVAFEAIVARFGRENVALLRLPRADEAATGRPNAYSRAVDNRLAKSGVKSGECELSHDDYLRFDRHPNEAGYRKVAQCVRNMLTALIEGC